MPTFCQLALLLVPMNLVARVHPGCSNSVELAGATLTSATAPMMAVCKKQKTVQMVSTTTELTTNELTPLCVAMVVAMRLAAPEARVVMTRTTTRPLYNHDPLFLYVVAWALSVFFLGLLFDLLCCPAGSHGLSCHASVLFSL